MKICMLNAKGGVGRTTLSLNLAGCLAKRYPDKRILVADNDPQGSALAWASLADETPFTVGATRSRGYDIEIFDTAPRIPANGQLPQADIYLVPTLLDGVAHCVYLRTVELLKDQGLPYMAVANKVNPRRAEHRMRLASDELKDALVVQERASLASYYAHGVTIFDMTGPWVSHAQRDIDALTDAVVKRCGGAS